jgi:hypothetical protein
MGGELERVLALAPCDPRRVRAALRAAGALIGPQRAVQPEGNKQSLVEGSRLLGLPRSLGVGSSPGGTESQGLAQRALRYSRRVIELSCPQCPRGGLQAGEDDDEGDAKMGGDDGSEGAFLSDSEDDADA